MPKKKSHTDEYLLSLTVYGPAIIGQEMYEAVQEARKRTMADEKGMNVLGPAMLGPAVQPLAAK